MTRNIQALKERAPLPRNYTFFVWYELANEDDGPLPVNRMPGDLLQKHMRDSGLIVNVANPYNEYDLLRMHVTLVATESLVATECDERRLVEALPDMLFNVNGVDLQLYAYRRLRT